MSSTSKPKNVSFENIRLVSKFSTHKKDRKRSAMNLKEAARNFPQNFEEDEFSEDEFDK